MGRNFLNSIYTRFIVFFLGAFFISMLIAIIISFTQYASIEASVRDIIENRASQIKSLVLEQGISVSSAGKYLTTSDVNISVGDTLDRTKEKITDKEFKKINNGEIVIHIKPFTNNHIVSFLKLNNKYLIIRPDIINNPVSKFISFQKTLFIFPIFTGTFLIILAVRKVVRPIKEISAASKEVAKGNFEVQIKIRGKDEIANLSENFNLMVKELSSNEYLHKDFVSNVSHEFKTPITSLMGYAKLLKSTDLSAEQLNEYADIILSESQRLSNLSSNLLKLSELENEVIFHKKDRFLLSEQIRDALLLLQNQWEAKELELDLELPDVFFTGDKDLLHQVWINLFSNAIKFSNLGGKLKITLKNIDGILVEIIDKGVGMTKDEKERVFLRFYKADKSRKNTGTGLGLSIAKRIVEIHNGSILVESEVGKGSKFTVKL